MQRTPIKKAQDGPKVQAAQEENVVSTNSDNKPPVVEAKKTEDGSYILQDTKFESPKSESVASTTPSEKELEDNKNGTAHQEQVVAEYLEKTVHVQEELAKLEEVACQNRQHDFEQRTKTHLAVPAKKFIQACQTLVFQLDRSQFSDEISRQYGDQLLNEVLVAYANVEEARAYCLEPLTIEERQNPKYADYMTKKFEARVICERMHQKYFEEQEEKKRLRQLQQEQAQANQFQKSQVQQPPLITSTPLPQGPQFRPPHQPLGQSLGDQNHQQSQKQQSGQQNQNSNNQGFISPGDPNTGRWDHYQNLEQFQRQQFGQQSGQQQNPQGFQPLQEQNFESRNPTPTPSNYGMESASRFKLKEELLLVEKWDGTNPRAYMAFRAQWGNFVEKMIQARRSNLDLYYALLTVLEGTAKDLVKTKYPNNQSYSQAIHNLDVLFFNPTNLLREMVNNLLKGQKMVDTYESLLGGVTKLKDAWNDLDQADLSKEQLKGLLFVAATEKNLSEESWKCWIDVQNDPKYKQNPMAAFEISAYMGAINTAMLNAQKRRNAMGKESPNKGAPKTGKKQSTLYGSYSNTNQNNNKTPVKKPPAMKQAEGPNGTCIFCEKDSHKYQLYCPKLKQMQPNEIYNFMQKAGIECQMCLGLGHRSKNCPTAKEGFLKKCSIKENGSECGKYHSKYLHKTKKENTENPQPTQAKQE